MNIKSWWKRKAAESPLARVSRALLNDPGARHFGYPLSQSSGVRYAKLLRVLDWMLDQGWLTDGWESAAEADGRPPRRWYRPTPLGLDWLADVIEHAGEES